MIRTAVAKGNCIQGCLCWSSSVINMPVSSTEKKERTQVCCATAELGNVVL